MRFYDNSSYTCWDLSEQKTRSEKEKEIWENLEETLKLFWFLKMQSESQYVFWIQLWIYNYVGNCIQETVTTGWVLFNRFCYNRLETELGS